MTDGTPVTAESWPRRRRELLDILAREEYGDPPPAPLKVEGHVDEIIEKCCSGHAREEYISLTVTLPNGTFRFPLVFVRPNTVEKRPLILYLSFSKELYNHYTPVEEIIDSGFALAAIYYKDITTDDGDFSNGLAALLPRKDATDGGKLGMWAWAASRALDYFTTRPEIDLKNVAVAGHSRLGKTALLCAARDERFLFALANCSGCGGDALEQTKHPGAETYAVMAERFPFWFCGNRNKYVADQSAMPYDQHFLMAAIAPRFVATGSASLDDWADQYSQQLCCVAASPAWQLQGLAGFTGPEVPAAVGDVWEEGHIGYHLRDGVHFMGRPDWLAYLRFMKKHLQT